MVVTRYFLIGSATIPSSWISLMIGFIVAYIAVRLRYGKRISDVLGDTLFYFLLVWKLSVIITQFGNVIKSPLSILYFNGGRVGVVLGLFLVSIKLFAEKKKRNIRRDDWIALFIGFVIIQSVYQVMMVLWNEGTLIVQFVTIISFTLFTLFIWLSARKKNHSPVQFTLLFMAVHFFVASFQTAGIFGLSVITTMLICLFFMLLFFKEHRTESEGTL